MVSDTWEYRLRVVSYAKMDTFLFVFWPPDADAAVVEKNISRKSLNVWYEAHQTVDREKTKNVYCYISPKVSESYRYLEYHTGACTYRKTDAYQTHVGMKQSVDHISKT